MTSGYLKDILDKRPREARLLGLDVGKKTIGLALCDPSQTLATPLKTIQRTKFTRDILGLEKVVKDYEIEGFIIGLPLNADKTEGPRCQSVRDFALEMLRYPNVVGDAPWVAFWDERYSTISAENYVDGSVNKRKAKEKGITDKLAALVILQSALDYLSHCG
jgi:putative holliday junction resolvase